MDLRIARRQPVLANLAEEVVVFMNVSDPAQKPSQHIVIVGSPALGIPLVLIIARLTQILHGIVQVAFLGSDFTLFKIKYSLLAVGIVPLAFVFIAQQGLLFAQNFNS